MMTAEDAAALDIGEDEAPRRRRNYFLWVWYTGLFLFSFLIFFLFTFPYGVVKEAVIGEVSQMTGLNIRVKELGPSFLVGVGAEGIKISTQDNLATVEFKSADVTLSTLSLLLGRATFHVDIVSKNKGKLNASASWGLFQLISRKDMAPSAISLEAKDFELGPLVNLILRDKSKTANDMVKDLMTQINFQANLNGKAEINLSSSEPIQSTGAVDLQFKKASLNLTNPNLVIAQQNFDKALIKATLRGGKFIIDPSSALNSQELKVAFKGDTTLKNPIENSILNFVIGLKLEGTLKENFGFIMSVMGGNDTGVNYTINGSVGRPNFQGAP